MCEKVKQQKEIEGTRGEANGRNERRKMRRKSIVCSKTSVRSKRFVLIPQSVACCTHSGCLVVFIFYFCS
jgi:hypothetical protein